MPLFHSSEETNKGLMRISPNPDKPAYGFEQSERTIAVIRL